MCVAKVVITNGLLLKCSFGLGCWIGWDGGGRAELLDHSFHEGFGAEGLGWNSVAVSAGGEGLTVAGADDAAREGGEVVAGRGWGREGADVEAGDLESVEEAAALDGIDLASGDGEKEQGDGELDGLGVFQRRKGVGGGSGELGRILAVIEQILDGFRAQGTDPGCAGSIVAAAEGPVVEAEDGAGDGGRLATMAVGLDVPADVVLLSLGVHWFLDSAFKCEGPQGSSPCGGRLAALLF